MRPSQGCPLPNLKPLNNNVMNLEQAITELQSRGEHSINVLEYSETGVIKSRHGEYTLNYWVIKDGQLVCIDCKTIYNHSI